jgi:hypothetical protein
VSKRTKHPAPDAPTHIVDEPGGPSRCGLNRDDALPRVWAPFVQAHVDGHGLVVCAACATGLRITVAESVR